MNTRNHTVHKSPSRTETKPRRIRQDLHRCSDKRIKEEVCDFLAHHPGTNCSEIKVHVDHGTVILKGHVDENKTIKDAEEITEHVAGVNTIQNELRVRTKKRLK